MDSLAAMQVFVRVVETGGLSAAGRSLGLAPSSVSHRIAELEAMLGVKLLHRTTRKLSLTEAGETYYERALDIVGAVVEANLAVTEVRARPSGLLRVETVVEGTLAGVYREGGRELDIVLKGSKPGSLRSQDLGEIVLSSRTGRSVLLSDIAEVRPGTGPTKVQHVDLDRSVKLTANIREALPLGEAMALLEKSVIEEARRQLPLGYSIDLSGQAKSLVEAWNALKWSFLLAVVVSYLLMCSLFESWTYPFIIMFSVPLAMTGGILAVSLAHISEPTIKMDSVTMLGFIILAGIVVNNAILIVHQTLNFMREGRDPQEALLEGVRSRIRPIFMTSTTTVCAMLPLVLSRGSGSELFWCSYRSQTGRRVSC